ncbi:uncharacterized protein PG986_010129 [Apiospora aurea]|uniref:Restriction endonuclease domain-containing protein n=1 Tax=Apiospora aurea TaxID=335848 RepID=A0ABR1QA03_9PEZI
MDASFLPSGQSRPLPPLPGTDKCDKEFEAFRKEVIISGLVPTTFLFYQEGADPRMSMPATQHADYVRLAFPKSTQEGRGLSPLWVEQEMLRSARGLLRVPGEWREQRLCRLLDIYLVRELETPARTDLCRFRGSSRDPDRENPRLADWVEWGIAVKDPKKFRFEVVVELTTGGTGDIDM